MHSTSFSFVTGRHGHSFWPARYAPQLLHYIYIPGQSLSRIVFDLCGFSGAGLKITCGLRVMDSMTQFWCQKVGLSRLFASFCVIFLVLPNVTDRGQNQQLFDSWSLTTFQSRQKNAAFGCPGICIYIYIYITFIGFRLGFRVSLGFVYTVCFGFLWGFFKDPSLN